MEGWKTKIKTVILGMIGNEREGIKYSMRRRNESGRAPLVRETVRETERFHLINPIMQSKYTVLMEHGLCVCACVCLCPSVHKTHYRTPDWPSVLSTSQLAFKLTPHV